MDRFDTAFSIDEHSVLRDFLSVIIKKSYN